MLNRTYQVSPFSAKEWEVIWVANVPVAQSTPPYTQIYIKQTSNVQSNFWLSLGNGLVTYLADNASSSMSFLGDAYPTYSNNQFTIYVPTAVYGAIAAIQPPGVTSPGDPAPNAAGAAIRAVVNQYATSGSQYNIIKY